MGELAREYAEGIFRLSDAAHFEDWASEIRRLGAIVARLDSEDPFWELDAMAAISEIMVRECETA